MYIETHRKISTAQDARRLARKYHDRVSEVWLEQGGELIWASLRDGWECALSEGLSEIVCWSPQETDTHLDDTYRIL